MNLKSGTMCLSVNTIIHLEDDEKFVLLAETEYEDVRYFLAMGVDDANEIIRENIAILEEIIDEEDGEAAVYVDRVTDPELVITLTGILKSLI